MGQTAENVAEYENVSRQEMDEFACLSQNRAVENQESGFFEREITPVVLADGTTVIKDDGPRPDTTLEGLAKLKPVFRPDGKVTAGNACPLNDGAAAVLMMSSSRARELGVRPIARVVASGVSGLNPEIMGLGPIEASRQALKRAGMSIGDIDLAEIQRGLRRPGHPVCSPPRHRAGQAQRPRRRHRPRSSLRDDGRPHHDDPLERPRAPGQGDRPGDDVRRRRPGDGDDRRAAELTRCEASRRRGQGLSECPKSRGPEGL